MLLKISTKERGAISDVSFSPDSKSIVCNTGNNIVVLDIKSQKEVILAKDLEGKVLKTKYSPCGKYIFSIVDITLLTRDYSNAWKSFIGIFSAETGQLLKRYDAEVEIKLGQTILEGRFVNIISSPDGKVLAVCCEDKIMLWKAPGFIK